MMRINVQRGMRRGQYTLVAGDVRGGAGVHDPVLSGLRERSAVARSRLVESGVVP
jgi:hypothetical protein